jgi:hypothetical protein
MPVNFYPSYCINRYFQNRSSATPEIFLIATEVWDRATRLGEFSIIKRLFILGSSFKISEVNQISDYFLEWEKDMSYFNKNELGYILGVLGKKKLTRSPWFRPSQNNARLISSRCKLPTEAGWDCFQVSSWDEQAVDFQSVWPGWTMLRHLGTICPKIT